MRTILTDRLREKRTRGGRGSKKPENLRTYLMDAPLRPNVTATVNWYLVHVSRLEAPIMLSSTEGALVIPFCNSWHLLILDYMHSFVLNASVCQTEEASKRVVRWHCNEHLTRNRRLQPRRNAQSSRLRRGSLNLQLLYFIQTCTLPFAFSETVKLGISCGKLCHCKVV